MGIFQVLHAQTSYRFVEKGNKLESKEAYEEAEVAYRKSLEKDAELIIPSYNIGVVKYKQDNHDKAIERFTTAAENFKSPEEKAHAYHNLGNSYLSKAAYEESIAAYKEALKLVPNDMDTKYNLAYAQLMLRKEQQQEQEQQQEEDQQEQNQEEQEQDQQEQDQQEQGGDKESEDENEQKDGQQDEQEGNEEEEEKSPEEQEGKEDKQQPRPSQLTKEQADQLLRMLENEEGKLQEKLDEPEGEAVKIGIEKDW